jgi:hypothetical protein
MALPPGLRRVFRLATGRPDPDGDVTSEFEFHIATRIEQLVAQGLTPEAARAEALRQFGSPDGFAREVRDIDAQVARVSHRREWWSGVRQDLKLALRSARRSPLFATVVAVTFALGIGVNAAVFSLLDAVLLRPLPFPEADRLVRIYERDTNRDFGQVTAADFSDWRSQNSSFESLALFRFRQVALTGAGDATMLFGGEVSPEFFGLPDATDASATSGPMMRSRGAARDILSHGAWMTYFGGDPAIVAGPRDSATGKPRSSGSCLRSSCHRWHRQERNSRSGSPRTSTP